MSRHLLDAIKISGFIHSMLLKFILGHEVNIFMDKLLFMKRINKFCLKSFY